MTFDKVVKQQRDYFNTNATKDIRFRKQMLKKLHIAIQKNEEKIYEAIYKDLGKSKAETYMAEISVVYAEIKEALKKINRWSKPKRVGGTMATFPSKNYIITEPFGVVLILAPWNYPFQLTMAPLVGAIAAGNCAVVKCSKSSENTSRLLEKIISDTFDATYIYCSNIDEDNDVVVNQQYDYIFFTGSPRVGKIIMKAASEHLTPVSLELGGKSPCIVDESANLSVAAKRIVWGKFLNAGQTCITVDYIVVDNKVKDSFVEKLREEINRFYRDALTDERYPNIINEHHYNRLIQLIENESSVIGGEGDAQNLKIAPALFSNATFEDVIMEEEIFGPIIPIIGYNDLDEVIREIKSNPKPLACYVFTEKKAIANKVISEVSYGGGCVNDVLLHIANHHLPFGGVGNSGMGGYHGKHSYDTFSHKKGVVKNFTLFDLGFRYAPFDDKKHKTLKRLM